MRETRPSGAAGLTAPRTRPATTAPQGYKIKDEDYDAFDGGERLEGGIYTAVEAWCTDRAAAKALYGPIASWDVSEVTSMRWLFYNKREFDEDLSPWDVSNVRNMVSMFGGATSFRSNISEWDVGRVEYMNGMFYGATSFNVVLGGAWATSTADKMYMFDGGCPGSIAGMTNDQIGTPR